MIQFEAIYWTLQFGMNFVTSEGSNKLCGSRLMKYFKTHVHMSCKRDLVTIASLQMQILATVCVKDCGLHSQKYQYHNILHVSLVNLILHM